MAKLSVTMWIFIGILIIGAVIFGLMGTGFIKSDYSGTSTSSSNSPVYSQLQQRGQTGGRKNKKSKMMTTSGIYLLLAAVLVGFIISHFNF
jgi:hypothetical protein